jgi:ferredoxin
MAIKVDKEKCTGCGDCVDVCPVEAISVEKGKVVINEECVECGACVSTCKNEALSLD